MNRRKQTRPKRTTCSESNLSAEDCEAKVSQECIEDCLDKIETFMPPLMEGDSSQEGHAEQGESSNEKETESIITEPLGAENLDDSHAGLDSLQTQECVDHNIGSASVPSDAETIEGQACIKKVALNPKSSLNENGKAQLEGNLACTDCPSPVSGSESERDMGLSSRDLTKESQHVTSGLIIPELLGKTFSLEEQNFVQKLENFVASVERRTKLKPSTSTTFDKLCSYDGHKSRTLNGLSKHDIGSKYLYYDSCSRYIDGSLDQPLDLSVCPKDKLHDGKNLIYTSSLLSSSRPTGSDSRFSDTESSSLLASLEKKFGEHSQILDRIGSVPRVSHFGSSLVFNRGSGLLTPKPQEFGEHASACRKSFPYQSTGTGNTSSFYRQLSDNQMHAKERLAKDGGKKFNQISGNFTGTANNSKVSQGKKAEPTESTYQKKQRTTNLRCSCNMEFDRLYLLTVHLQETGHKPSSVKGEGEANLDSAKLVRGQDVWLHNGSEQTRLILRCMECQRSFRSLPELTVHMIQTEHYMNLIQPDLTPKRISNEQGSSSGSENNDTFSCQFCSKVFDDANALGEHIVNYGHYRRDVKQKFKAELLPTRETCISPKCSCINQKETSPVSVTSREVDRIQTSGKERLRKQDEDGCANGCNQSVNRQPSPTSESSEVPMKIPRLERMYDLVSAVNPNSSPPCGHQSINLASGLHSTTPQTSDVCEVPLSKMEHSKDRLGKTITGGDENLVMVEPRDTMPDKEPALKAMQSFINRSFFHLQDHQVSRTPNDLSHQRINQKSPTSASSRQPGANFLPKMGLADHLSPKSTLKRHHHESDRRPSEGHSTSESVRSPTPGDCCQHEDARKSNSRLPHCYGNSLFPFDSLWKSNPKAFDGGKEDHKGKYNESSSYYSPGGQTRGSLPLIGKPVSSPFAQTAGSFSVDETSSTRKSEKEKDEKPFPRSDKIGEISTLDSLQELVCSKSFKSLENFLHPSPISYVQGADNLNQSQALVISTKNSLKKSIPETLILVNPIVTVMPSNAAVNSGSSLSITLSPHNSPEYDTTKDNGTLPASLQMDNVDSDGEQYGEFKCSTCKRNFASKGSYRYHRSRYHAYPEIEKSKIKSQMVTSLYSHLTSDQTNKFSKYYQLASELSGKSN